MLVQLYEGSQGRAHEYDILIKKKNYIFFPQWSMQTAAPAGRGKGK